MTSFLKETGSLFYWLGPSPSPCAGSSPAKNFRTGKHPYLRSIRLRRSCRYSPALRGIGKIPRAIQACMRLQNQRPTDLTYVAICTKFALSASRKISGPCTNRQDLCSKHPFSWDFGPLSTEQTDSSVSPSPLQKRVVRVKDPGHSVGKDF